MLVIGAGALGQFALQYLRLVPESGAGLVVGVSEPVRRSAWRGPLSSAQMSALRRRAGSLDAMQLGGLADVVLDFVGTDSTLARAAAVIETDGLLILVGEAGGSLSFGFDRVTIESWLTTVAWGSLDDLRRVVDLAESGQVQWDVDTLPLADALAAHERLRAGDVRGRLVLVP